MYRWSAESKDGDKFRPVTARIKRKQTAYGPEYLSYYQKRLKEGFSSMPYAFGRVLFLFECGVRQGRAVCGLLKRGRRIHMQKAVGWLLKYAYQAYTREVKDC